MASSNILPSLSALAVPVTNLEHLDRNPRRGDVAAVAKSYKRFGQRKPIVARRTGENEDGPTGTVLAGNHQLAAAISLGWDTIAVVFVEEDEDTSKAYALADNRTAELGGFDEVLLAEVLSEIEAVDASLLEAASYSDLLEAGSKDNRKKEDTDADKVPEIPATPVTSPGDVWVLGRHRIVCGDATDPKVWQAVLGDKKTANICFTSPPYNAGSSTKLSGNKAMAEGGNFYQQYSDDTSTEQYLELLSSFTDIALSYTEVTIVNIQMLAGNKKALPSYLYKYSNNLADVAIWNKEHGAPNPVAGVMGAAFEFILFLTSTDTGRRIPTAKFQGTVSNVYTAPPQRNNEYASLHGATFPVHLPKWILETFEGSKKGSIVDPFSGTGTTILAAEETGRTAYGIELDPLYVDVTCRRFQEYTGIVPVLERTGEPHDFTNGDKDE